jgi:hypothetical protein
MSWWVYLKDENGNIVQVESHQEGGTYIAFRRYELPIPNEENVCTSIDVAGNTEAKLNITYNYGKFYRQVLNETDSLWCLNNKRAKDCIKLLANAIDVLTVERDEDYWKATSGNAGYALSILLSWALAYPEAILYVS